jgi:hypothetical protein
MGNAIAASTAEAPRQSWATFRALTRARRASASLRARIISLHTRGLRFRRHWMRTVEDALNVRGLVNPGQVIIRE